MTEYFKERVRGNFEETCIKIYNDVIVTAWKTVNYEIEKSIY